MRVILLCLVVALLGFGCSTEAESEPQRADEAADLAAPTEVAVPAEVPAAPSRDHRLQLGIDGDPGYEQQELTPEELAKVRAEGEQAPAPSYAEQPEDPSPTEQAPSEQPSETEEGVNSYYGYGERDALYRERERERLRQEGVEEKSPAAHSEEAPHAERPVERPHLGRVR